MHLELKQELDKILVSAELSAQLNFSPFDLNFQITEPVDRNFGLLASNLAFVFSKKLKEREGVLVSPQIVADRICHLVDKKRFEVSVDGGGFINVNPTSEFVVQYIVSEPAPLESDIFIDWTSATMIEKLRMSDEALFFLRELASRVTSLSQSDSLQLLSILSDPEINSNSYLRGFDGRENTPAYFLKFLEVIGSLPGPKGKLILNEGQSFVEKLLLFRGRLEESVLRSHPERVIWHMLSLVREFFDQYNRPTARRFIFEQRELSLLFYAASCGKQVQAALNALKFSCQLPVTVL